MGSTPMGPSLVALVTGAPPGLPPSESIQIDLNLLTLIIIRSITSLILVEFFNNSYFPFKKGEIVKYSKWSHLDFSEM